MSDGVAGSIALMPQFIDESAALARAADDDLVTRAQRGDRLAFGQLVETHYDFIFRVACKWSGKRSDAEDIARRTLQPDRLDCAASPTPSLPR